MTKTLKAGTTISWLFGAVVFTTGILNIFLVHPVPGLVYLLLSFLYFPPAQALLQEKANVTLITLVKLMLGVVVIMFTLGVSDLGDMIDKM